MKSSTTQKTKSIKIVKALPATTTTVQGPRDCFPLG